MKHPILFFLVLVLFGCKPDKKAETPLSGQNESPKTSYAEGFSIEKYASGLTLIHINNPWPESEAKFTYALVPKDKRRQIAINNAAYDAVISVPVERVIVSSTTHIPALEALEVLDKLVGFPDTQYVSSKAARQRIDSGLVKELGSNETLNTEIALALNPDLVIAFSVDGTNKAYETLKRSQIPVCYNGDWTEKTPLGKAEWIKFFAPFFQKEAKAAATFDTIESEYLNAKSLASKTDQRPTVLSGALYKDVWYLPGGNSWAAQFLQDAHTDYLWKDDSATGSLSLSWEAVLEKAQNADFWISPSQFIDYESMKAASPHYQQFRAFQEKKLFTFAQTVGDTGGLLYYELAPHRPDLVLKDLVHIFHPELLPEHKTFFFKPLK